MRLNPMKETNRLLEDILRFLRRRFGHAESHQNRSHWRHHGTQESQQEGQLLLVQLIPLPSGTVS